MVEVTLDLDNMWATVSRPCGIKYAHKLLQDTLKSSTPFKGGWFTWLCEEKSTEEYLKFKLTNPYVDLAKILL